MLIDNELRIAVVDDIESDRVQIMTQTKDILEHANISHSMDCYEDGKALLDEMHRGRKYDLLLLDVLMDEMDGITLAAELRSCGKTAATPLSFLSPSVRKWHTGAIGSMHSGILQSPWTARN